MTVGIATLVENVPASAQSDATGEEVDSLLHVSHSPYQIVLRVLRRLHFFLGVIISWWKKNMVCEIHTNHVRSTLATVFQHHKNVLPAVRIFSDLSLAVAPLRTDRAASWLALLLT